MYNITNFPSLNPLIHSEGGLHFTAYITKKPGSPSVYHQLLEAIRVAAEDIRPVLSRTDRKNFLMPLQSLLKNRSTVTSIKGNFAIFRTKQFFRILLVPVEVEEYSTVASSFHVKPLLKWAQEDGAFRLLTMNKNMACLFLGTQHSLRLIGSRVLKKGPKPRKLGTLQLFKNNFSQQANSEQLFELIDWLHELFVNNSTSDSLPLYVSAPSTAQNFISDHFHLRTITNLPETKPTQLAGLLAKIRSLQRHQLHKNTSRKLYDFKIAEALELTESNLDSIARSATLGRVRKLLIATDKKLFGKVQNPWGKIVHHFADVDHEDEDILDDIAQTVINQGGDVVVAPIKEIPGHHPAIAIVEAEDLSYRTKIGLKRDDIKLLTNNKLNLNEISKTPLYRKIPETRESR